MLGGVHCVRPRNSCELRELGLWVHEERLALHHVDLLAGEVGEHAFELLGVLATPAVGVVAMRQ